MKIVFITQSGHAPTKKFAERLISENVKVAPGEEFTTYAGAIYMNPQVLRAGIEKGEVDRVFVITSLPFPPTAYQLTVIAKPALADYGKALELAKKGESAWDVATRFFRENKKMSERNWRKADSRLPSISRL